MLLPALSEEKIEREREREREAGVIRDEIGSAVLFATNRAG